MPSMNYCYLALCLSFPLPVEFKYLPAKIGKTRHIELEQ